jgi:hypothetical protein
MERLAGHGVALKVLEDYGHTAGAVDTQVKYRAGVRKRMAKLARIDLERERIFAAAVDHAGYLTGASKTARGARAIGVAVRDGQGSCFRTGHGRRTMVAKRPSRAPIERATLNVCQASLS